MKENFDQENIRLGNAYENAAKKWRHQFIKRVHQKKPRKISVC